MFLINFSLNKQPDGFPTVHSWHISENRHLKTMVEGIPSLSMEDFCMELIFTPTAFILTEVPIHLYTFKPILLH